MTVLFEDLVVSKNTRGDLYKVNLIDRTCYIKRSLADMIAKESREDPYLIAIILAYIKIARRNNNSKKDIENDSDFSDTLLLTSISSLLDHFDIERIIYSFSELKWYEMKKILQNSKPWRKIEDYI